MSFVEMVGQCAYDENYSRRVDRIDYEMHLALNTSDKQVDGVQKIEWKNHSPDTIFSMQFYMYLNAFKSLETTYLKDTGGKLFGNDISNRKENEWGYVDIKKISIRGEDHLNKMRYIHPDDDNEKDESVLEIELLKPIMPGETIAIEMNFISKLPKTISRAGYGRNNYYLFVHWYPQPGVFEQDINGNWGWNCHQFMQRTEFYGEFGNYLVEITLPQELVVGASGCQSNEIIRDNGTKTLTFEANDVVNFAWSAYPDFERYSDEWNGTEITMLIPSEHCRMAPRYLGALKNALEYLESYLGPYPYPSITLVDPPLHTLNSGFMEYPMLITCASFYIVPDGIRTIESLAIHEFTHQYFMGILASNEKEAPWLDEGFVTFFEDEIMDHYYGGQSHSLFDFMGYQSGNKEQSRLEYTSLPDLRVGTIARPGWEIKTAYKELVYAKMATVLQTVKGLIGPHKMQEVLQHYYQVNKFSHPREEDWRNAVKSIVGDHILTMSTDLFMDQCLHSTGVCDYAITNYSSLENAEGQIVHSVQVERLGELFFPQEIQFNYVNGYSKIVSWDGEEEQKIFVDASETPLKSIIVDPYQKIYLDVDFNNNSYKPNPNSQPAWNFGMKAMSFVEHLLLSTNFLF